jgi:hypothetical protein
VGTSAVRYVPNTPFVDKAKSHNRTEGEQINAWKRTLAAVQESFFGPDATVVHAEPVSHEIAQQQRVNAVQGLNHFECRCQNGAARYPKSVSTSFDIDEDVQHFRRTKL